MRKKVTIIDYGMGNLGSVENAFYYLGAKVIITKSPRDILRADVLVLPGVGSFRAAMRTLRSSGLEESIREAVQERGKKILGICLGMQMLGVDSSEDGITPGLCLIDASVRRFVIERLPFQKIPHIGFNAVTLGQQSKLLSGLEGHSNFYFVHSYRMLPAGLDGCVSTCDYGEVFVAAYENNNIFATQFHPEKSQTNGLRLLKNFLVS